MADSWPVMIRWTELEMRDARLRHGGLLTRDLQVILYKSIPERSGHNKSSPFFCMVGHVSVGLGIVILEYVTDEIILGYVVEICIL